MTANLSKLERKGYVELMPNTEDRRQKNVRITESGKMARRRGLLATAPLGAVLAEGVDSSKLSAILPILTELRRYLDEARNAEDGLT